jgi:hypothetical protein
MNSVMISIARSWTRIASGLATPPGSTSAS